jgi:hypothetical protein
VGINPSSVATGDFNGDGLLDLAVADTSFNTVSVLLGNGSGEFGTATNFGVGLNPYSVATGDFNGDGVLDLAAVGSARPPTSVWDLIPILWRRGTLITTASST